MSLNHKKIYLCQLENQELGAKLYDMAMIQNRGLNARTNFDYNKAQLLAIITNKNIVDINK